MKISTPEEMQKAAQTLLSCLERGAGREGDALVLLLSGDLGSGKTTFVQALARELGVVERVTSPTFVIQKEYLIEKSEGYSMGTARPFDRLIHIDAYRLKEFSELGILGWNNYIHDERTIVAIEWPEQVGIPAVPERTISLSFSHISEDVRGLLFNGHEELC